MKKKIALPFLFAQAQQKELCFGTNRENFPIW